MDDLNFAELGLGGNPALVEVGLCVEVMLLEKVLSRTLSGICKEERFGRLDC